MPYTGSPSTSNTDAVRLLVHDTSTSTGSVLLTDAEYQWFIDQNTNLYYAAAAAAGSIGARYADDEIRKKVGDFEYELGGSDGPGAQYRALSKHLRAEGARKGVKPYAGGISIADVTANETDPDWNRTFTTGGSVLWDT